MKGRFGNPKLRSIGGYVQGLGSWGFTVFGCRALGYRVLPTRSGFRASGWADGLGHILSLNLSPAGERRGLSNEKPETVGSIVGYLLFQDPYDRTFKQ